MIKILFFIENITEGGAEKVLCNLVNNMDQSKFDITVQTIDKQDPKKYLVDGINYKSINKCKTKFGKKLFRYWFRFCTEYKLVYPLYIKDDYDIEVAYLECGPTKVMSSSTNSKALKLAWVHCDLAKKEGVSDNPDKSKKYYKKYDKAVCVSEDVKRSFDSLFGDCVSSVVIHNVVDEDEVYRKASEKLPVSQNTSVKNLLAVGRLTYQKGFERLVEVCAKLRDDGENFKLRILGEGSERKKLESLIKEYRLEDVVKLMGFVDNPYPYINAADYIVCSSRYEGISTVITEALLLGKPVVTMPCTGMSELLGDSEYGLITENSIEGLYNGLKKIMNSVEVEQAYIKAAKKRGADFMKHSVVNETEKFFMSEIMLKQ